MSAARAWRPKRPRNLALTVALAALLLGIYAAGGGLGPRSPKTGVGLGFGILATLLFVFEMAYPFRRPRAWPLRSALAWMQAHAYLGAVALLAVVLHSGWRWPGGWMGWALLLLSGWVTLTGLLGVFLQKWIPSTLAEQLQVEALFERIPELVRKLREEADALVQDASDVLENFYRTQVREPLSTPQPSWSYLFDVRGGRERALEPFRRMAQFVAAEEREKVEDLMALYTEKLELDAHYRMQWVLRRWLALTVHVGAAGLLMGLLAVHIATWLLY